MGKNFNRIAVAGALLAGGLYAKDALEDQFLCLREPGFEACGVGILGDITESVGDFLDGKVPYTGGSNPLTAEVTGGITDIEIKPLTWTLFKRDIELVPLQINQDGDTKYEETSISSVTTSMEGRIADIEYDGPDGRSIYVMAVDDNKTPEIATDDKMVPINVNDFKMISEVGKSWTYGNPDNPAEAEALYNDCVTRLKAGDEDYRGCVNSGTNGHDGSVPASVLDNIRSQHIFYDGCVVKTLHVVSNNVLGGEIVTDDWEEIHEKTVTVGDITAESLQERFSISNGVPKERVHVIMEMEGGHPVEWDPGDKVDLHAVEVMSGGQYKAPDVYAPQFCTDRSWSNRKTAAEETKTLIRLFGEKITDKAWLESNIYVPPASPIPADILAIKFLPDGSYSVPAPTPSVVGG